jgi:hypothetical protein
MFGGVALALSELPTELIEAHGLERRIHERGGEPEVQFLHRDRERLLPVWLEGRLHVLPWGSRRGESRLLPATGWTWQATVEEGKWAELGAEPVVVPASMGLDRGVWYRIREGLRGLVVTDENGLTRVYVVCEPASHYYQVMTRSPWMPCLVGERI